LKKRAWLELKRKNPNAAQVMSAASKILSKGPVGPAVSARALTLTRKLTLTREGLEAIASTLTRETPMILL
jgi:hypothetical protein